MRKQRRIHRGTGHLEAAAIDELFRAPDDEKIAVAIDIAEIAGPEPAFENAPPVRGRIAFVAVEDLGSAHDDLACLARWQAARPASPRIANSLPAGRPTGADARQTPGGNGF